MNRGTLVVQSERLPKAGASEPSALSVELRFPIHVLGKSQANIVPQRVGAWWLEPLSEETQLPERAQARLDAFLESGVKSKSVVVFHEIPKGPVEPPLLVKAASKGIGLIQQYLAKGREEREWTRRSKYKIDPCLVVVLEDGTWVELDRWDV